TIERSSSSGSVRSDRSDRSDRSGRGRREGMAMSQIPDERWSRNCEGVSRRDVLRVGVLSALGLSLPDLLRMQAARAAASGKPARETSCILIYQSGGPSHLETFDLKPDAPADLRGEFKPIPTKVSGIQICEHLPRLAQG